VEPDDREEIAPVEPEALHALISIEDVTQGMVGFLG
jgi:hypothetical protein